MSESVSRHETLLLLSHLTGKPRTQILLEPDLPLPEDKTRAFFDALKRRESGEPLQYILGKWDFYGLTFKVDRRALIPRPETELLAEAAIKQTEGLHTPHILDICTGGGCIAVTLAKLTGAKVTAVDISPDALALAKENADLHGVGERVRFAQSDLAEIILGESPGIYDIVVSNPPYIPTSQMQALQKEVRDYEPRLALDGGSDGMDLYRRLVPQAMELLKPGGTLLMEIGPPEVKKITEAAGFADVRLIKDYAGLDRIICAVKPYNCINA